MIAWPLFKGRLTVVKPRSVVYFCVAGTLFTIILTTASFFLIKVFVIDGQPVSFFVSRSVVLRSVIIYLESVIIAIVLYAVILHKDLILRRRQRHQPPAEGEDQ
jgi:hypothetical protein